VPDVKQWDSRLGQLRIILGFPRGGRVAGPADAAGHDDSQYWWLLPGDMGYPAAPAANPEMD
jgi:hypothetical protein